jgi:hypothetical protein
VHQVERWCGKGCKDAVNKELVGNSYEPWRMEETSEGGQDSLWVVVPMMMMMMMNQFSQIQYLWFLYNTLIICKYTSSFYSISLKEVIISYTTSFSSMLKLHKANIPLVSRRSVAIKTI